jgi:hypothetical protein
VLPLVGSTIVEPGRRTPSFSAFSTMARAILSFTDPPGLSDSSLTSTSAPDFGTTRFSRTSGVPPMTSRTDV